MRKVLNQIKLWNILRAKKRNTHLNLCLNQEFQYINSRLHRLRDLILLLIDLEKDTNSQLEAHLLMEITQQVNPQLQNLKRQPNLLVLIENTVDNNHS